MFLKGRLSRQSARQLQDIVNVKCWLVSVCLRGVEETRPPSEGAEHRDMNGLKVAAEPRGDDCRQLPAEGRDYFSLFAPTLSPLIPLKGC